MCTGLKQRDKSDYIKRAKFKRYTERIGYTFKKSLTKLVFTLRSNTLKVSLWFSQETGELTEIQ